MSSFGVNDIWTQQAELFASDLCEFCRFGSAVAVEGDTIVIGAVHYAPPSSSGAVYIFGRSDGVWSEQDTLTLSAPDTNDVFGRSVAISGDTIVVGAPGRDAGATQAGAAYVYLMSGGTWTEEAELLASDAAAERRFGTSVAIDGDTIAVGASGNGEADDNAGSACVFVRSDGTWTEQALLTASDGAADDRFGGGGDPQRRHRRCRSAL